MPFILRARDYTDPEAIDRRMGARDAHGVYLSKLKAEGKALYGVALLDMNGKMCGSTVILNVETREEVEAYLAAEPYMAARVWETVEVEPCKVGAAFAN